MSAHVTQWSGLPYTKPRPWHWPIWNLITASVPPHAYDATYGMTS
jgi:hypothetical protein